MSNLELHNGIEVPLQQFNDSILLRIKLDITINGDCLYLLLISEE